MSLSLGESWAGLRGIGADGAMGAIAGVRAGRRRPARLCGFAPLLNAPLASWGALGAVSRVPSLAGGTGPRGPLALPRGPQWPCQERRAPHERTDARQARWW